MSTITTKEFLMASCAYTLACILWSFPAGSSAHERGTIVLVFSGFIGMRRADLSRSLKRRDALMIPLVLAMIVLPSLLIDRISPGRLSAWVHRPVSIMLLWAFIIWCLFRRWKHPGSSMDGKAV